MNNPAQRKQKTRYTVPELAEILGLTPESVYRAIRAREIPHLRVGRRVILPKAAIDRWLDAAQVEAVTA